MFFIILEPWQKTFYSEFFRILEETVLPNGKIEIKVESHCIDCFNNYCIRCSELSYLSLN